MGLPALSISSLKKTDSLEVYKKWQQLARKYDCFVHSTSFATLKNYPDFALKEVSTDKNGPIRATLDFVRQNLDPHTLFLIDLPLISALKYAYFMNRELGILPVLTVRHLSHPYGLVGDKDSISALIGYADLITDNDMDSPNYLFILDSKRNSSFAEDIYTIHFNNQYELNKHDLPSLEMLNENGISKAIILYEKSLKKDTAHYKDFLTESRIDVRCFDTVICGECLATE